MHCHRGSRVNDRAITGETVRSALMPVVLTPDRPRYFPSMEVPVSSVAYYLDKLHYLGAAQRGLAWSDEHGVMVLAKPTSRRLPHDGTWLELSRWCLVGTPNG